MIADVLLDQFLGRRHTLRYAGRDVTLTVQRLAFTTGAAGLATGNLGRVQLTATDVIWPGGRLDRLALTADEVRLRPALAPAVVLTARSIRIEVTVAAERLSAWLPARRRVDVRIGPDGVLRAVLRVAPGMGGVELEPEVTGSSIRLRPRAVRMGRSLRVPIRLPAYRLGIPQLPHRLRVTAVEPGPATVTVCGTVPRWERVLSMTAVSELLARPASVPDLSPSPRSTASACSIRDRCPYPW
jgi:hypothetical protein